MEVEIILIDDDEISLLITKKILMVNTFLVKHSTITSFSEPGEAVDYINTLQFQEGRGYVILLDINMPKINGWDFLDLVHDNVHNEKVSFIMLSSSISEQDKEQAKENPLVKEFLIKPLDFEQCKVVEGIVAGSLPAN